MSECCLSGRDQGHVINLYILDLENFAAASRRYTMWYTQLDRRRFVYDTYKTMKATRTRHGRVHMFTTHRPALNLQLHNFDLFRTCRTALLRSNWQNFNWHDASRGPSAIYKLLVFKLQRRQRSQVFSVIVCVNIVANGKYSGCYYW